MEYITQGEGATPDGFGDIQAKTSSVFVKLQGLKTDKEVAL
jgi:hypothetical protein